jgi:hypothetical protein
VVLIKLRLELTVEAADQLLCGLLVRQKPICNSCQALVQMRAKVVSSAVEMLLQRVKLCLNVADGLGLLHSRTVLLAELGFHVLHESCKSVLKVRWADRMASQVADVSSQGSLHGVHIHAQEVERLAHVWGEARFGQKGCIQKGVRGANCRRVRGSGSQMGSLTVDQRWG